MDNLKSPAAPHIKYGLYGEGPELSYSETNEKKPGFTKLELAALMIAQGLISELGKEIFWSGDNIDTIASRSVSIARHVLEEANK